MAALRDIFLAGVETAFSVFEEAVNSGTLTNSSDDGFGTTSEETDTIRCLFESFSANDVATLSFSKLIQPTDIKGLLPYVDVINCEISTNATATFDGDEYTIEAFEIDPMNVIYTLLLRKV